MELIESHTAHDCARGRPDGRRVRNVMGKIKVTTVKDQGFARNPASRIKSRWVVSAFSTHFA